MREESLQFYLNGVFEGVDAFSTKKEELVKRTVEIFHSLSKKRSVAGRGGFSKTDNSKIFLYF